MLKKARISVKQFKKSWAHVQHTLSDDELFSLFKDSGFSPRRDHGIAGRLTFVRNVFQQYKNAKKVFFGV